MGRPFNLGKGTGKVGRLLLAHDVLIFGGSAAPTNGTSGTGANQAGPGSIYIRSTGKLYTNVGTKLSPSWTTLAVAIASESASASLSKSPSASVSPSASASPS